jgi:hypothetical protein
MRLAEDKIKQAILHPERGGRETAVRYFSESRSADASVMPLVIRALETYGRTTAFRFNHHLNDLAQTERTVDWAIAELHRDLQGSAVERYFYFLALSRLLLHADFHLVARRAPEILHAPGFDPRERAAFQERLHLYGWDAETCWKELTRLCESEKDKDTIEEFAFGRALRIVEALARQGHPYRDEILSVLAQEVRDYRRSPLKWLQPLAACLAGAMRLPAAIPLLVPNLGHPYSFLADQSLFALARIGTEAVVEAVCGRFNGAGRDYRSWASDLLGKIHSDTAVQRVLDVLPAETDLRIRMNLCEALLSHFSLEGLEPTRQLVLHAPLTPDLRHLRAELVWTCTVMEARFPDFARWEEAAREDARDEEEKVQAIRGMIYECQGDLGMVVEKMKARAGAAPGVPGDRRPSPPPPVRRTPASTPSRFGAPPKVGRNDPCPCGSGKKYKNCCMRR